MNKCSKCQGNMEEGISVDFTYGGPRKGSWASKISWGGLKTDNMKTIDSYRCTQCGYIENYAK